MTMTRQARCSCGQLKITCEGEPVRASICHCHACQRRTGSVFGMQLRFPSDKLSIEGRATEWVRVGDSGGRITFRFCPECGATVYWTLDGLPGFTAVAAGAFADATLKVPTVSVYEARKHPWVVLPPDVEHLD